MMANCCNCEWNSVFVRLGRRHLSCYRMLLITFCQKLICSGWFLKRPLSGSVIHMEPLEPARPQPPYIPINGKKGWEGVLDSDRCSLIVILHPCGYSSFHICRHRLSDCSAPQHKLNTLCLEGTCAKNTSACSTFILKFYLVLFCEDQGGLSIVLSLFCYIRLFCCFIYHVIIFKKLHPTLTFFMVKMSLKKETIIICFSFNFTFLTFWFKL